MHVLFARKQKQRAVEFGTVLLLCFYFHIFLVGITNAKSHHHHNHKDPAAHDGDFDDHDGDSDSNAVADVDVDVDTDSHAKSGDDSTKLDTYHHDHPDHLPDIKYKTKPQRYQHRNRKLKSIHRSVTSYAHNPSSSSSENESKAKTKPKTKTEQYGRSQGSRTKSNRILTRNRNQNAGHKRKNNPLPNSKETLPEQNRLLNKAQSPSKSKPRSKPRFKPSRMKLARTKVPIPVQVPEAAEIPPPNKVKITIKSNNEPKKTIKIASDPNTDHNININHKIIGGDSRNANPLQNQNQNKNLEFKTNHNPESKITEAPITEHYTNRPNNLQKLLSHLKLSNHNLLQSRRFTTTDIPLRFKPFNSDGFGEGTRGHLNNVLMRSQRQHFFQFPQFNFAKQSKPKPQPELELSRQTQAMLSKLSKQLLIQPTLMAIRQLELQSLGLNQNENENLKQNLNKNQNLNQKLNKNSFKNFQQIPNQNLIQSPNQNLIQSPNQNSNPNPNQSPNQNLKQNQHENQNHKPIQNSIHFESKSESKSESNSEIKTDSDEELKSESKSESQSKSNSETRSETLETKQNQHQNQNQQRKQDEQKIKLIRKRSEMILVTLLKNLYKIIDNIQPNFKCKSNPEDRVSKAAKRVIEIINKKQSKVSNWTSLYWKTIGSLKEYNDFTVFTEFLEFFKDQLYHTEMSSNLPEDKGPANSIPTSVVIAVGSINEVRDYTLQQCERE